MNKLDLLLTELISENPQFSNTEIPADLKEKRRLLHILSTVRMPSALSSEFIEIQDEELKQQLAEKGIVEIDDIASIKKNPRLKLWQGDITRLRVDAIVTAANSRMLGCFTPLHACIDNVIHTAAGIQLRLACNELMTKQSFPEPTGSAKITKGYNLPAKHVVHTVGPIIQGDDVTDEDKLALASCYQECLKMADSKNLQSIAFCCISTGEFRFPNQQAAEIAINTTEKYFENNRASNITTVIFNVFKDFDMTIYEQLLNGEM